MTETVAPLEAYGRALVELGHENDKVVVLDADLAPATKVSYFAQAIPERFFQVGIAEQNMVGMAAGMATCGYIPFTSTLAVFSTTRVMDQIRVTVAQPRLNVKIVGTFLGLIPGRVGKTHQAIEDVAVMRALPNMVVVSPVDANETRAALRAIAAYDGPVYMRVPREPAPNFMPADEFQIGRATMLCQGSDITIISTGMMTGHALLAAQTLAEEGISVTLLHVPTIKPIDTQAIVDAATRTGLVLTAEDHNIIGGLGGAVCEVLSQYRPTPVYRLGIMDTFGQTGRNEELLEEYGLMPHHVAAAARDWLKSHRS
jgi:transketolase